MFKYKQIFIKINEYIETTFEVDTEISYQDLLNSKVYLEEKISTTSKLIDFYSCVPKYFIEFQPEIELYEHHITYAEKRYNALNINLETLKKELEGIDRQITKFKDSSIIKITKNLYVKSAQINAKIIVTSSIILAFLIILTFIIQYLNIGIVGYKIYEIFKNMVI